MPAGATQTDYVQFTQGGELRGAIGTSANGQGVQISSAAGDFAEWHQKLDETEELQAKTAAFLHSCLLPFPLALAGACL